MKKYLITLVMVLPLIGISQQEKKFGIKFHGFVKTDIFYDSRQTVDAREGHFLLYPKDEDLDDLGADINAASKFNILSIQTRLKGVITGPDIWGAKTSGLIEGAFFGNIKTDINGFRLRHAFVKLSWPKTELLAGQFWHPMFVAGCFPGTVSFNTGAPFEPFARNPQVRFTKKFGKVNLLATALEQVDFVSTGPHGARRTYLINSMPELNLRLEYKSEKFYTGLGGNFKRLKPTLSISTYTNNDNITLKANDYVSGMSFYGFVKIAPKPVTVKLYGVYGQMMYSMTMLGGYAVSGADSIPVSGNYAYSSFNYTPINTMSFWFDFNTNGKKLKVGLFAGYTKNLGTSDKKYLFPDGAGQTYARGANIAYAYRIAPRLIYNTGKFRIAPELEYTVAAYATKDSKIDEYGIITDPKEIGNFRVLLGVYFFF
jgi:hypothetical protein